MARKALWYVLLIGMCCGMTGCGDTSKPEDDVVQYMEYLKNGQYREAASTFTFYNEEDQWDIVEYVNRWKDYTLYQYEILKVAKKGGEVYRLQDGKWKKVHIPITYKVFVITQEKWENRDLLDTIENRMYSFEMIKDQGEWKLIRHANIFGEFEELEGIIDSYDDVRNYEFQAQNE